MQKEALLFGGAPFFSEENYMRRLTVFFKVFFLFTLFHQYGLCFSKTTFDGQRSPDNPLARSLLYAPFREKYINKAFGKKNL